MPGDELAALVRRWDVLLLGQADELPWPVRTSGTVLRPGASEVAILELEARLGVELPPSYRSFLALTDGAWAQVGWGVKGLWDEPDDGNEEWALGFLDTARVGWFRDREPSYVDIWTSGDWQLEDDSSNPGFRRLIPECEYLDHDRDQDVVHAKGGHVAYALQISGDVDGYTVLLNPLVVSQHGEWEAWDFGSKLPGANRYRAFDALLAADVARLEREAVAPPTFDVDSVVPVALDESRPIEERVNAANQAVWGGERERVLPVLALALADRSLDVGVRQAAAQALGRIDDPRAVAALVAAAGDPEPRLQSAVLPPLASRDEPESRRSALSILTAPDVEDFVVRSVWPGGAETLWQAWRVREDLRLLEWLAYCHDRRACAPLAEAIVDPDVDASIRERLIGYAWWPGDQAVVPALVEASALPGAPLQSIGEALLHLGATEEGVAVLVRAVREDDPFGRAASELGWLRRPEALDVLVDAFLDDPTASVAGALGWYDDDAACDALQAAAHRPDLSSAVVDALERMRGERSLDALAALEDDLRAARALARRRDERALEPLLRALSSDDLDVAFEGADGLRDLRSLAAAHALLSEVQAGRDDDVVACSAHALVAMKAPEAEAALAVLADTGSKCLRRLAEIWT